METVNGLMLLALLIALVLTLAVSYLLVWLFKKRVEGMIDSQNDFTFEPVSPALVRHSQAFPGLTRIAAGKGEPQSPLIPHWSAFVPHVIPALVMGVFLQVGVFKQETPPAVTLFLFLCSISPLLFVIRVISIPGTGVFRNGLLAYLGAFVLVILYSLTRNSISAVFALGLLLGPYLVTTLVFFLFRSLTTIRTIAPFVFPVAFIAFVLLGLTLNVLSSDQPLLESTFNVFYNFFHAVGLPGFTSSAMLVTMLVLFLILAGGGLILLRHAYLSKNINGQIIMMDCLWLSHIVFTMSLPYKDLRALTYSAALFALYKIIQWVLMKLTQKKRLGIVRRLLVLRVFSLGKKSERLFSIVSSHWLNHGFIKLIAGYDLTNSLVDIDDLLAFISGRIRRRFCLSKALIVENVGKIDIRPDLDGRYRTNEMYCNNSTWQVVLDQLLPGTDRVLMDLRGFEVKNAGCIHEIQQLVYAVPLDKVVFVSDEEGVIDESDLYKVAEEAWANLPADSPNYNNPEARFNIYVLGGNKNIPGLLAVL
jgi:hypothetical protein